MSEHDKTEQMQAWGKLLCCKRLGQEGGSDNIASNEFRKDYDRVVFCSAFRRLGRKTQVHPLAKHDHVHTRLTHSIEVGSVGRTLGYKIGNWLVAEQFLPDGFVPDDLASILQAACLAHDIGNPPFGHAGEYAIRHWFRENEQELRQCGMDDRVEDFTKFEGNAQGFRIVSQLENRRNEGGLRLTYATLASLVKYPWFSNDKRASSKFNFYHAEKNISYELFTALGLVSSEGNISVFKKHPLSYLLEAADDICYKVLDIEDAIEMELVHFNEVETVLKKVAGNFMDVSVNRSGWSKRRKISELRSKCIKSLIQEVEQIFIENYQSIMSGSFSGDLLSRVDGEIKTGLDEIDRFARENIFIHRRKIELELGAYEIIATILDAAITSIKESRSGNMSFKSSRVAELLGGNRYNKKLSDIDFYQSCLLVVDQVSGMTDNYAMYIANQLRGVISAYV